MSFLRRLFGHHVSDVPVRLWALTPTVSPHDAAKLAARPVRLPSGSNVYFLFGDNARKTPPQNASQPARESVGMRAKNMWDDDYAESTVVPPPIPVDFEDLPAA